MRYQSSANAHRLSAVVASATASVAAACDRQVGQVRTALSHACEAEVRQLRAVLAEACAGETDKLRAALSRACDDELVRVSDALASACSREVMTVSETCQTEVDRVKQALRAACELEVSAVREACRTEVEMVKESLREACEAEVRHVRAACQNEIQRVKSDLAQACQAEVAALVTSMQHEVLTAKSEQRKQLELAAEPYMRVVQSAHAETSQQLQTLCSRVDNESHRLHAFEAELVNANRKIRGMSLEVASQQRSAAIDAEARRGAAFLLLRVHRPEGALAELLHTRSQLLVGSYSMRLAPQRDAIVMHDLSRHPVLHKLGPPFEVSDRDVRLPLSSLIDVRLGAPTWCARAAAFDMPALQRIADVELATSSDGIYFQDRAQSPWHANADLATSPPTWHMITLQLREGTPTFLCAPSEEQAIEWTTAIAQYWAVTVGLRRGSMRTYPGLLWKRVRLRLDALAAQLSPGTHTSWLSALASVLRTMAAEEVARRQWARSHLLDNEQS